jgi:glycosyltransferase involved in cell wall biosynthesis
MRLSVAIITAEMREHKKDYANPTPGFGSPLEAILPGFASFPDVDFHYISCLRQPVNAPEKLAGNIWYHALHVPKIGWIRTGYQGCIRATRKKLREINPHIVHGQGTEHNNALCAVFSGFPNVLTIHGNMRLVARINRAKPFSFEWLAARLESFTIPRSQGVVCISNYTRDAVAALAKRTWVVPNAVDENFFGVQSQPAPAPATLLFVGAISPRKNQNNFIRALDPLAKQRNIEVIFAGQAMKEDPYGTEFRQLVGARPWCKHIGYVNQDTLRNYLRTATLLVLPSLEDNCPMVVLESMAAGVPVLAAKVGGVPDLIEEGMSGLFCDPSSLESMRSGVAKILDHPAVARGLAVEARRRARERFHPRIIAQRHLEIYREVLESSGGR